MGAIKVPSNATVAAALLGCLLSLMAATELCAAWTERQDDPTCAAEQVWDAKNEKCIPKEGANLSDGNLLDYARTLADAERYQDALGVLDMLKEPNTAKALNARGFVTRKLGRTDEGIAHYLKSISLDPGYAEAREYLGEAYVIKGRTDLAREQLAVIETLCGRECEEYRDLAEAIENPPRN